MYDPAINHRTSRPVLDGAALDSAIDEAGQNWPRCSAHLAAASRAGSPGPAPCSGACSTGGWP